jgi:hypothetical protein
LRLHGVEGLRLELYFSNELLDTGDEIVVPRRGTWRVVEAIGPIEGTFRDGVADLVPAQSEPQAA